MWVLHNVISELKNPKSTFLGISYNYSYSVQFDLNYELLDLQCSVWR